ncbi:hypothetical protein DINM_006800 [Dirofilaria immitis]|nr:hypothetical protein [Dirofilaria immitis]
MVINSPNYRTGQNNNALHYCGDDMSKQEANSMSENKKNDILKGGHAPAEKIAGGQDASQEDYDDELEEQSKNILAHSGLVAKTNKDYPEEAIRAYHEKQIPQVHKPTKPNATLFQPTKQ